MLSSNKQEPREPDYQDNPRNLSNTSISLDNHGDSRQGIITVMFGLPDELAAWVANTWWDGKIEMNEDKKRVMIPNAEYYKCPVCKETYSASSSPLYSECRGTKDKPHKKRITIPVDWHPLCSRTGISFLLGQLQANINPNIQTGNFGKNMLDVENKVDQDSRFLRMSVKTGIAIIGSLLSNKDNYAPWLLDDKTYQRLPQVFSIPFLTSVMTETGMNIYSSYTKGKGLAAVGKVLDTRAHIEQEITNKSERSAFEQQSSDRQNALSGLFHLNEPKK